MCRSKHSPTTTFAPRRTKKQEPGSKLLLSLCYTRCNSYSCYLLMKLCAMTHGHSLKQGPPYVDIVRLRKVTGPGHEESRTAGDPCARLSPFGQDGQSLLGTVRSASGLMLNGIK